MPHLTSFGDLLNAMLDTLEARGIEPGSVGESGFTITLDGHPVRVAFSPGGSGAPAPFVPSEQDWEDAHRIFDDRQISPDERAQLASHGCV